MALPKQPFNGPIPGQSLTTPQKQFPYERPPQLVKPEEVVEAYQEKLQDPKLMEDILTMLDLKGATLTELTKGLVRLGVAKGVHSIDSGLLVAPWLHETIRDAADKAGIDYDEGLVNKEEEANHEKAVVKAYAAKGIREGSSGIPQGQLPQDEQEVIVVDPPKSAKKKGLMEKPSKQDA